MAYAVIGFVVLLLGMFGFIRLRTWWGQRTQDEEKYHFTCSKCRRRFAYRARQAGHKGACPRCGQNLIFPPVPILAAGRR